MQSISDTAQGIAQAGELLRSGSVGAFPTETVYGLGANAFSAQAVARIYEIKERPLSHPLIVHVANAEEAFALAQTVPEYAHVLARKFWPGPLTLVFKRRTSPLPGHAIADLVTAGLDTVAVRVPSHPTALALLRSAAVPVAAPSANPFGRISPTEAPHVVNALADRIDFVLHSSRSQVGIESTIVSCTEPTPRVLRLGGLSFEDLQAELPSILLPTNDAKPIAPGMLEHHYAPRTRLRITTLEDLTRGQNDPAIGLLCLAPLPGFYFSGAQEFLSPSGNLREAAGNLYAALHRLDSLGLREILALPFPEEGLGRSINDRLRRASA